jgi:hypothetical protein
MVNGVGILPVRGRGNTMPLALMLDQLGKCCGFLLLIVVALIYHGYLFFRFAL